MTSDSPADEPASPDPAPDENRAIPPAASVEGEGEQHPLVTSELGSGLLAQQPTVEAQTIAVLKVCPQCGTEYETAARFCPADGTALRPKGSDSLVGRVLADRYHILKLIGEGGMGRVYLGEHVKMNRQCALKVMSPALVNDAESSSRFAREASNAARIIHPNVAAVFDYGESEGLVYLVMEYVDGEPLSRLLAREAPFSLDRAIELARQIADGLGAAHELGIVHRDLKPDNILVSRKQNGREAVKVVDFGIAKAMQEQAGEALTRTGLVIGTPEFMSPEQLLGDPIDARSDLYALGCILHLMLTATPAFEAPTREQMIKRRLSEDPPSVQALDPGLPDSINRIVARLLARTPGDRYGSAVELRDALGGTHTRRVSADGVSEVPRVDTPRSAPTQMFDAAVAPSGTTTIASRRKRWPMLVGGLVVLGAAGFFGIQAQRRAEVQRIAAAQAADSIRRFQDSVRSADSAQLALNSGVTMRDSLATAERARADSMRAVRDSLRLKVLSTLRDYSDAVQSGDTSRVRLAFPGVPLSELVRYQNIFQRFSQTYDFKMRPLVPANIASGLRSNDSVVEVDVILRESLFDRRLRQETSLPQQRRRARLVRQGTGWRLETLTPS